MLLPQDCHSLWRIFLQHQNIPILRLMQPEEIAQKLITKFLPEFSKLGFELTDFRIEGHSFDEDTMKRINSIADTSAETQAADVAGVSFSQLQQLGAMRDAAKNEGGTGMGMGMGVGFGFGQAATVR